MRSPFPRTSTLRPPRRQRAFTLIEVVCVLAIIAVVLAIVTPRVIALQDTTAVRGAINDADAFLATARTLAVTRSTPVTVDLDTAMEAFVLRIGRDTLHRRDEGALRRVQLHATRTSVTYTPIGLALGGSNLTLVVRRGAAAETLTVSRLGRVRRPP